jgi:hypothetical protein
LGRFARALPMDQHRFLLVIPERGQKLIAQ